MLYHSIKVHLIHFVSESLPRQCKYLSEALLQNDLTQVETRHSTKFCAIEVLTRYLKAGTVTFQMVDCMFLTYRQLRDKVIVPTQGSKRRRFCHKDSPSTQGNLVQRRILSTKKRKNPYQATVLACTVPDLEAEVTTLECAVPCKRSSYDVGSIMPDRK